MVNLARIVLDAEQSAHVLDQAVRAHPTVVLSSNPDRGPAAVETHLLDALPHAVLLRPRLIGALAWPFSRDGACGCRMLMWPVHYLFETRVLEFHSDLVILVRPESLTMLERRRSPRTRLARSCDVHLCWGATQTPRRAVGKLLNLSPEGMACRVDLATAEELSVGDSVEALLILDGDSERIELRAVVRSLTPGGSPNTCLLGVEFVVGGRSQSSIRRLRDHVGAHRVSNLTAEYVG